MQLLKKTVTDNTTSILLKEESIFCISLENIVETLPFDDSYYNNDITKVEIYKNNELIDDYYLNYILEVFLIEHLKKYIKIKFYFFGDFTDQLLLFGLKEILLQSGLINENDLVIQWNEPKKIVYLNNLIYEKNFY